MPTTRPNPSFAILIAITIAISTLAHPVEADDDVPPKTFESVTAASSFVGREIEELPGHLGEVADLLLDLQTSQAVAAVFRQQVDNGITAEVTLPIIAIRATQRGHRTQPWVTDAMIQQVKRAGGLHPQRPAYTRGWVSKQFTTLNREPYWRSYAKRRAANRSRLVFDEIDYPLTRLSEVLGLDVVDKQDQPVGQVEQVVISPNTFEVAYVVLKTASSKRLAIPLAAFETESGKEWKIELDRETIIARPGLEESGRQDGQLPLSVDRAWSEYVAVRYGDIGVQPK